MKKNEELLKNLIELAHCYTPEWNVDIDTPDAGTAMIMIYKEMFESLYSKYNLMNKKNKIEFFNKLGATLLPAIPAKGYLSFELIDDLDEGVYVKKSTKALASNEDDELIYETINDLYVTPSSVKALFLSNKNRDYIAKLSRENFCLFDFKDDNLQNHELYIGLNSEMLIINETKIIIDFIYAIEEAKINELLCEFTNKDIAKIEYYTKEGFVKFSKIEAIGSKLILYKDSKSPKSINTVMNELKEEELLLYWIKIKVNNISKIRNIRFNELKFVSSGYNIELDSIYSDGYEQMSNKFLPFSDRFSEFDEVYFISKEVFNKKKALISMSFDLDFEKFPIENLDIKMPEKEWKWLMKKKDLKPDKEYEIKINSVIWEYYNGIGWSRLIVDDRYSNIFTYSEDVNGKRIHMKFLCPSDIEEYIVNSDVTYSIRARILKVDNPFKLNGNYLTPVISRLRLNYEYADDFFEPKYLIMNNNLETAIYDYNNKLQYKKNIENENIIKSVKNKITPFYSVEDEKSTIYIGFDKEIKQGPIKILFVLEESIQEKLPVLNFEYYSKGKWNTLNIVDETDYFSKTGIITFISNNDFDIKELWGNTLYWIRIIDDSNYYLKSNITFPKIKGIYINSCEVLEVETMETEYFDISAGERNYICELNNNNIYDAKVYINEIDKINLIEEDLYYEDIDIEYEYDENSVVKNAWIRWEEVESFILSKPEDRHFKLDRINGKIIFSDSKNGAIPTGKSENSIKVVYRCGGGNKGNIEANTIDRLDSANSYIKDIKNHIAVSGGCNQENIKESINRNSYRLKHGLKAVTTRDYELLAKEASTNVLKAKCFSGYDDKQNYQLGYVTLVILQKDYKESNNSFEILKNDLIKYYSKKIPNELVEMKRFNIVAPEFLVVNIEITIKLNSFDYAFEIRKNIINRLEEFINPVSGKFDNKGWNIGELPNKTQIINCLKGIKNIKYIKNVRLVYLKRTNKGYIEIDINRSDKKYAMALYGECRVDFDVQI